MTVDSLTQEVHHSPHRFARLDNDAPTRWMMAAWDDMAAAPWLSMGWGTLFAGLGIALSVGLHLAGLGSLIPAAMAGFFLVAPILTVGMMDIARRRSLRQSSSWRTSLSAWQRNASGLGGMGLALMLAMTAWLQIALLVFTLFFHSNPPSLDNFIADLLSSDQAAPFLLTGTLLGGILAAIVFALVALAVPILMERSDLAVIEAMSLSVGFVWANKQVMAAWAVTIVVLTGFGLLTLFLGLIIGLPLVAYGSWHCYEDFKSLCE